MEKKLTSQEKLVKLFEGVSRVDMKKFKQYLDSKQVLNENPQPEPTIAPNQPEVLPAPSPVPATPATKPATRPNPFAPSIEPDADPKAVAEQEGQGKPIDILAKKLSDEIAATYNKAKGGAQGQQATPQ
jgi:hypothetical protein